MQLLAFWSKKRTLRAFNLRVSVEKNGAANRTRTGTESLQVDFKSTMSTYSIIAAYASLKNEGWKVGGMFWRDAPNFPNFKFKKLTFL